MRQNLENRARQARGLLAKSRAVGGWRAGLRYGATALLVGLSLLTCLLLEPVASYPLFAFTPPVIVASFLFGRKAGYFAAVLGAIVAANFLISFDSIPVPGEASKLVAIGAFVLLGLVTAYAIETIRVAIDVLADIAELREENRGLEKELFQAQKLEAMGRANSILAHDFKNILTPVMSSVYVLRERLAGDDEAKALLDVLDGACRYGTRLADDIRAFGRREQAECVAVDLNAALQEALPVFVQGLPPGIHTDLRLQDGLPAACLDPALLERALANIIDNAADAMPDGGTLTISTGVERLDTLDCFCGFGRCASGDYLCLAVTDTGTGIRPEVQARIFEPFFTTKPSGQGTGLGMAMVADFVRHAQGFVEVQSQPGSGTTVRLFLPAASTAAGVPATESRRRDEREPAGGIGMANRLSSQS